MPLSLLLFPVALGVFGLAFRYYAQTSGYNPALMMALFGGAMLGCALMMFVYAMYSACHGHYDLTQTTFACTYPNTKPHGP